MTERDRSIFVTLAVVGVALVLVLLWLNSIGEVQEWLRGGG